MPNLWVSQGHPPPIKLTATIYTHYIHSVVVQDFVSGRACCVNQYHYESRKRRVVTRLFHATGKTCYKVLYKRTKFYWWRMTLRKPQIWHLSTIFLLDVGTMLYFFAFHFIDLFWRCFNLEIRLTNVYNTLRETTFCALRHVCCRSFYCFVKVAHIDVF
jgi:hypothetical protein